MIEWIKKITIQDIIVTIMIMIIAAIIAFIAFKEHKEKRNTLETQTRYEQMKGGKEMTKIEVFRGNFFNDIMPDAKEWLNQKIDNIKVIDICLTITYEDEEKGELTETETIKH